MVDVSRKLKAVREELSRFQQTVHLKQQERQKLQGEMQAMEQRIREVSAMERELRLKKSLIGRLDIELSQLNTQKVRLEREIPAIEREFQLMEQQRKFGSGL